MSADVLIGLSANRETIRFLYTGYNVPDKLLKVHFTKRCLKSSCVCAQSCQINCYTERQLNDKLHVPMCFPCRAIS